MKTDGRAGYLTNGSYQLMKAGEYTLQVMGNVTSNGKKKSLDDVLLNETVMLDEDVGHLEVRVNVDESVELSISGYELRLITKE